MAASANRGRSSRTALLARDATPVRSDVARNRLALMQAARELYATGADVPMYEVGRRAGVGQATLYRHFPDKAALAAAVAEEMVQELESQAATLGRRAESFTTLLQSVVDMVARSRGLIEVIREVRTDTPRLNDVTRRLFGLFEAPLADARAAGLVRDEFQLEDILLVINMVQGTLDTAPRQQSRRLATARRALAVISRGITTT